MRTMIVLNGQVRDYGTCKRIADTCDRILCADGGGRHLRQMSVLPDVLVGDLDSIDPESLEWMERGGVPIRRYPVAKDFTDSELAIRIAMEDSEIQPDEIWLIGAFGERLDHVLANMGMADRLTGLGIRVWMSDGAGYATSVRGPEDLRIDLDDLDLKMPAISVVPTETMTGVTLEGVAYPLKDATLDPGGTLGISNEPATGSKHIEVHFSTGKGLVTLFPAN